MTLGFSFFLVRFYHEVIFQKHLFFCFSNLFLAKKKCHKSATATCKKPQPKRYHRLPQELIEKQNRSDTTIQINKITETTELNLQMRVESMTQTYLTPPKKHRICLDKSPFPENSPKVPSDCTHVFYLCKWLLANIIVGNFKYAIRHTHVKPHKGAAKWGSVGGRKVNSHDGDQFRLVDDAVI